MAAGEIRGGGGRAKDRKDAEKITKQQQGDIPGEWMGNWSGGDVGYKHTDGGTGKREYGRNEREKAERKGINARRDR